MEKILRIEEVYGIKFITDSYGNYDGYNIITDKQTIFLGIENGQSCCENWGYFMTEYDFPDFIGAELLDIKVTDTLLKEVPGIDVNGMYSGGVMFVDIITNEGTLQFVAYNEHNGYYGHTACVISKQLNHTEQL